MKTKDKEFIKEMISSDFKSISNQDFTFETIERIKELKEKKTIYLNSSDISLLFPVIIYVLFFILLSVITACISWIELEQIENILYSIETVSGYLLHPVTVSILVTFLLLYLIDLFLEKGSTLFTKPNMRSTKMRGFVV